MEDAGAARSGHAAPGRLRVSLRVSLVMFSLITIGLTAVAVHLPWRHVSGENVAEMARQLNAEIVSGVDREVAALFGGAVVMQQALRDMLADGVIDIEDTARRERLMLAMLRANPHVSLISVGRPNGDVFEALRGDGDAIRIASSRWSRERQIADRIETRFLDGADGMTPTISTQESVSDFAPDRAWYKAAMAAPGAQVWTGLRILFASGKPGVNTAVTVGRRGGETLLGVLTVAVELDRISHYLDSVDEQRPGAAFIVNADGFLIAFSDPSAIRPDEVTGAHGHGAGEAPALRHLHQAADPLLQLASRAVLEEGADLAGRAAPFQREVAGVDGVRHFVSFAPGGRPGWWVGTIIPVSDFLGGIERNQHRLALGLAAAVLVVTALTLLAARALFIRPLQALARETRKIAQFDLDSVKRVPSRLVELDALSGAIEQMGRGLDSFRRYMPARLVRTLLDSGMVAKLGGERRTVSILFMDLQGFTGATERLGHRVVPLLGEYFTAMTDAIQAEQGTVDKFIGDAVMAFWGAPHHDEEHPTRVCRAALACQARMAALRGLWAGRGLPPLALRIGVNTGRVVVGNIGAAERMSYTVVGDPVNLAAMLEAMCKQVGAGILISQQTFELAKFDIVARRIDAVKPKGKREAVAVYELLAMREEDGEAPPGFEWLDAFDAAQALYAEGRCREAAEKFRDVLTVRPEDGPSMAFLALCEERLGRAALTIAQDAAAG